MTALLFAIDAHHSECVRELLLAGANPDGPCWCAADVDNRRTPLVRAMLNNSVSSFRLLLQAGASCQRADNTGERAEVDNELVLLTASRCTDVIQRLLLAAAAALGLQLQVTQPTLCPNTTSASFLQTHAFFEGYNVTSVR